MLNKINFTFNKFFTDFLKLFPSVEVTGGKENQDSDLTIKKVKESFTIDILDSLQEEYDTPDSFYEKYKFKHYGLPILFST